MPPRKWSDRRNGDISFEAIQPWSCRRDHRKSGVENPQRNLHSLEWVTNETPTSARRELRELISFRIFCLIFTGFFCRFYHDSSDTTRWTQHNTTKQTFVYSVKIHAESSIRIPAQRPLVGQNPSDSWEDRANSPVFSALTERSDQRKFVVPSEEHSFRETKVADRPPKQKTRILGEERFGHKHVRTISKLCFELMSCPASRHRCLLPCMA